MKIRLLSDVWCPCNEMGITDLPYPPWEHRECHSCRKSLPVEKLFMLTISSNTLLCPDCIATLHSITNPLSVLITLGIDTSANPKS